MNVKIQKKGTNTEYDITSYVDEDAEPIVNKEHERTAFEVTWDDLRLTLTNQDSFFSTLFADVSATWIIRMTAPAFDGEVQKNTIEFDNIEEKVSFDVFSMNKIFWDRAKTTRINQNFNADEKTYEYSTVLYLLQFNLHPNYSEIFRDLFDTVTILDRSYDSAKYDYDYAARTIRWYKCGDIYDIVSMSVEDSRIHLGITVPYEAGDDIVIWGVEGAECNWEGQTVNINGQHVVNDVSGESFTLLRVHIDVAGTGGQVIRVPRNQAGYLVDLPFNDSLTGRYADLADDTSIEELLKALEIFYNAEFAIDYSVKTLYMKRRHTPNISAVKSIDGLVCDGDEIKHYIEDEDKYDYLYTVTKAVEAPAPLATITEPSGYSSSIFYRKPTDRIYYVSNVIDDKEVALSKPLKVSLVWKEIENQAGAYYTTQLVTLSIPPGLAGTTKRYIYSNVCGHEDLGIYKRKEINNNDATTWEDLGGYTTKIPDWLQEPVAGWIGYDENTQAWTDPILDVFNGVNRPEGKKIFEVYPQLRFVNTISRSPINSQTLFDIFCFFGKDTTLESVKENWIPLFLTKARLECPVNSTEFEIDDEITKPKYPFLNALSSKNFRVVKARVNTRTEETQLEMIQL